MKALTRIGLLVATFAAAPLGGVYAQATESDEKTMAEDLRPTIYVEYREDEFDPDRTRYNTINNELDRFHYLKRNFEKVFAEEDWGVNFEFKLYPINDEEGIEVLEIAMLSFDSRNPIEVELRSWVKFRGKGAEEDFGVQSIRHAPGPLFTPSSIERDLDTIYSRLARNIAKELNKTIFSSE